MTREEAILWLQVLKHSQINWVGEQAEDEDIIAKCEEAEQEAFDMAIEALSADAVQGEWQKVEEQPYFRKHYDTVCCSVCRKKGNRKWNYCPNCGAIMENKE